MYIHIQMDNDKNNLIVKKHKMLIRICLYGISIFYSYIVCVNPKQVFVEHCC